MEWYFKVCVTLCLGWGLPAVGPVPEKDGRVNRRKWQWWRWFNLRCHGDAGSRWLTGKAGGEFISAASEGAVSTCEMWNSFCVAYINTLGEGLFISNGHGSYHNATHMSHQPRDRGWEEEREETLRREGERKPGKSRFWCIRYKFRAFFNIPTKSRLFLSLQRISFTAWKFFS